jgi:hypothetical protein
LSRSNRNANGNGSTTTEAPAESTPDQTGYAVYGAFLDAELKAQDARKASFEQRGLAVVTTSGVLVTLLFALAGLSTEAKQTFALPQNARAWLAAALVAFILAAAAALATNLPLSYQAVEADDVKGRLKESPVRSGPMVEKDVALTRVKALASAKRKNGFKGWLLFAAILLEVVAVTLLGVAVWIVISP